MTNPPPIAPNWDPNNGNNGILATNRYDFQKHVEGLAFRHQANQIDLNPTMVIGGNTITDVQDALEALLLAINPLPILATATTPGLVQLSALGDVQGTALQMQVTGIRGFPVNSAPPIFNNVLTWNGSNWGPASSQGVFTAGTDLAGNASSQQVIGWTGTGISPNRTVRASNDIVQFITTATPVITQASVAGINATNLTMEAQGISSGSSNAGNIALFGGTNLGSGLSGGVNLSVGGSPVTEGGNYLLQATQVVPNQEVVAFFPTLGTGLVAGDMPTNTGSKVIYIGDTTVLPTAPSPTGSILWSNGGQLFVMQENGVSFAIGSVVNPSIQFAFSGLTTYTGTPPANGSITFSNVGASVTNASATVLVFPMPSACALRMDITYIGKQSNNANVVEYSANHGFISNGAGPIFIGSTIISQITSGAVGGWALPPTPSISGNNILVQTGFNIATYISWTVITKITIVSI